MEASTGTARKPADVVATILGVLGTVAGVTFALYLVGVLFEFRRLKTLGLPADQPVSAMPHDLLIVIGVRSLVVPLGVALATAAAEGLADAVPLRSMRQSAWTGWFAAALLALVAAGAGYFVAAPFNGRIFWEHLGLVAGALILLGVLREPRTRRWVHESVPGRREFGVFCVMLVVAAVVAYAHAMHTPVHFDKATVFFARGSPRRGFYVGRDSGEIFLVPRADDTTTCPVLDVLSASDVKRIELERGKATTGGVVQGTRCVKPAPVTDRTK